MAIPFLVTDDSEFGFLAFGDQPRGIIAIGGAPTGVIAIGGIATGVIAVACGIARGVVAVSCGVAVGGVAYVCGAGFGFKTGAIGLGLGVLEGSGMGIGLWPGPFPRREANGETVALSNVLESGDPGWVHGRLVADDRLAVGNETHPVVFEPDVDVPAFVGEEVHVELDLSPARQTDRAYRERPENELVGRAIRSAFLPPPSRTSWYLRAAGSIALAAGILAAATWGLIW